MYLSTLLAFLARQKNAAKEFLQEIRTPIDIDMASFMEYHFKKAFPNTYIDD
jgi:hypothetical protein